MSKLIRYTLLYLSFVYISSVQIKLEFFLTGFICMLIYPTDGTDHSCSFQILQETLLKHLMDTQNSERNIKQNVKLKHALVL